MDSKDIDRKLYDFLSGSLPEQERGEVEEWLGRDEDHLFYFQQFKKEFLEMRWGMRTPLILGNFGQLQKTLSQRRRFRLFRNIAAVIILFIGIGGGLFLTRQLSVSKSVVVVVGDSIQPGKRQAILVLASGEQLKLDSLVQEVTEQEGVAIRIIDGALNYKQSDSVKLLCNAYHQLIIPRGGEYMMQLTDGTKVWLNAATEFRYPAAFVGAERKVYLSGEAYFEVAKDSLHPFIVVADDAQIRVYGTKFDVSNYGTGNIRTVLVEGAVGLQRGQEEVRLKPGQKGETDGDHIRVTEVDVASYIAWKNGDFIFDNERLEDIMEQISRWYDVDVFYSREQSRDIRLSGDLRRYKEVQSLLYYFERISDIRFSIKGRTIVVE